METAVDGIVEGDGNGQRGRTKAYADEIVEVVVWDPAEVRAVMWSGGVSRFVP